MYNELLKNREAWLGEDGVVAADGGASDADVLLLNGYHNPKEPDEFWYNFCQSSTRFFIEETFGRWKNRFRFLLDASNGMHLILFNRLVYASMILHNFCTVCIKKNVDLFCLIFYYSSTHVS